MVGDERISTVRVSSGLLLKLQFGFVLPETFKLLVMGHSVKVIVIGNMKLRQNKTGLRV